MSPATRGPWRTGAHPPMTLGEGARAVGESCVVVDLLDHERDAQPQGRVDHAAKPGPQPAPWRLLPVGGHALDPTGIEAQLDAGDVPATLKIGASSSLLMATMTLESFMPARCWIAPEMPQAM